jgi:hypothetical protein
LRRVPVFKNPKAHPEILQKLGPKLRVVLEESSTHRSFLDSVWSELYRPNQPAPPDPPPKLSKNQNRRANQRTKLLAKSKGQEYIPGLRAKQQVLGKTPLKAGKGVSPNISSSSSSSSSSTNKMSCPKCANLPMEERCVRILKVKHRNCSHLVGAALTCAPVGDRLKPKPPVSVIHIFTSQN